jgi:hypothetical protein
VDEQHEKEKRRRLHHQIQPITNRHFGKDKDALMSKIGNCLGESVSCEARAAQNRTA